MELEKLLQKLFVHYISKLLPVYKLLAACDDICNVVAGDSNLYLLQLVIYLKTCR